MPLGPAFGDVAPRESVTDELGTYLHVTISPGGRGLPHRRPRHARPLDRRQLVGRAEPARGAAVRRHVRRRADDRLDRPGSRRGRLGRMGRLDRRALLRSRRRRPHEARGLRPADSDLQRPRQLHAAAGARRAGPAGRRHHHGRLALERAARGRRVADDHRHGRRRRIASATRRRSPPRRAGLHQDEAEGFESLADGEEGHYLTTARRGATRSSASRDGWLIRAYDLSWESIIEGVSQA